METADRDARPRRTLSKAARNGQAAGHGKRNVDAHAIISQQETMLRTLVVRLLTAAEQVLSKDHEEARQCIARAATLLRTTFDHRSGVERTASTRARGCLAPWQVSRATEFIEVNIANVIRMQDLAALTHLSVSYFCRAFKGSIGVSPYAYVLRRRIEHAQELMLLTDKPLSQIALECGLADQPHLTRHFQRLVGVSPAAWRRLRRVMPEG